MGEEPWEVAPVSTMGLTSEETPGLWAGGEEGPPIGALPKAPPPPWEAHKTVFTTGLHPPSLPLSHAHTHTLVLVTHTHTYTHQPGLDTHN